MLQVLKRIGVFLSIGAVIGDLITMELAPRLLTWFHTPGTGSALCNCADVARETASALIRAQLTGTAVGAVGMVVLGELLVRLYEARRKQKRLAERAAFVAANPNLVAGPGTDPPRDTEAVPAPFSNSEEPPQSST